MVLNVGYEIEVDFFIWKKVHVILYLKIMAHSENLKYSLLVFSSSSNLYISEE